MPNLQTINADILPLTAEAMDEQDAFDAAQVRASGKLRRIASGYLLDAPGVVRHFADSSEMCAHVFQEARKQHE